MPALHQIFSKSIEIKAVIKPAQGHQIGVDVLLLQLGKALRELTVGGPAEHVGTIEQMLSRRCGGEILGGNGMGTPSRQQHQHSQQQCGKQPNQRDAPHHLNSRLRQSAV